MDKLKAQLKSVANSLASLTKQVERISKSANKLQPTKQATAARKSTTKKGTTSRGKTVLDTVHDLIKRSRKGATIGQLKAKTELDARQLSNALYKLTKKGLIHAQSRGLYMKK